MRFPPFPTADDALDALFETVKDFDSMIWVDFHKGSYNDHRTCSFTVYSKQHVTVEVLCEDDVFMSEAEVAAGMAAIDRLYDRILRYGGVVWFREEDRHLYTHRIGKHGAIMGDDQDAILAAIRIGELSWARIDKDPSP